jgi:hypothetical protein
MVWTAKRGMVPIDEILKWAKSMKPSWPLGIKDDERKGVISAIMDTLKVAGFGEEIQKQERFEIRNEFFYLHRPAIVL